MSFGQPYRNAITIYTKSECCRCADIKEAIEKYGKHLTLPVIFINVDKYLEQTPKAFEHFMDDLTDNSKMFPFIFEDKVFVRLRPFIKRLEEAAQPKIELEFTE